MAVKAYIKLFSVIIDSNITVLFPKGNKNGTIKILRSRRDRVVSFQFQYQFVEDSSFPVPSITKENYSVCGLGWVIVCRKNRHYCPLVMFFQGSMFKVPRI